MGRGLPVVELNRIARDEPVDPDVAVALEGSERKALVAVCLGSMLGAAARYFIEQTWPAGLDSFPWATLLINASGSLALPFVAIAAAGLWPSAWLARPALGTGVLGGFTTFSTFAVEQRRLFGDGALATGVLYLASTLALCALAAWLGIRLARRTVARWTA
jgi:CrcB protein